MFHIFIERQPFGGVLKEYVKENTKKLQGKGFDVSLLQV